MTVFRFGDTPYQTQSIAGAMIAEFLKKGSRLEAPKVCAIALGGVISFRSQFDVVDDVTNNGKEAWDAWIAVVYRCFDARPASRPPFSELVTVLSGMLEAQNGILPAARDIGSLPSPAK